MRRTGRNYRNLLVGLLEVVCSLPLQKVKDGDSIPVRFPALALARHVAISLQVRGMLRSLPVHVVICVLARNWEFCVEPIQSSNAVL